MKSENGISTFSGQSEAIGFLLERTAKRMKQAFQHALQQAGHNITVDQWVVLQELGRKDGQPQFDIAHAVYKDAATLTRIIDLLVQKGYARRTVDPEDRRRFKVELTKEGGSMIKAVTPLVQTFRQKAWSDLDHRQKQCMVDGLNRVFDNLED